MKALFRSPRMPFAVTLAVGLVLGFGSIAIAKLLNVDACPLCIIQRMLNMLLALVAAAALIAADTQLARRIGSALMAAIAALGAFTAGYQIWLQRYAVEVSCTADEPWWETFVDWVSRKLPTLFQVSGICSDATFKIFGFSLAEWSFAGFLFLLVVALWGLCGKAFGCCNGCQNTCGQ